MNARNKLNRFHFLGNFALAAVLGGLLRSWLLFLLVFAGLVWLSLATNEIRPRHPKNRPFNKPRLRKGKKHGP